MHARCMHADLARDPLVVDVLDARRVRPLEARHVGIDLQCVHDACMHVVAPVRGAGHLDGPPGGVPSQVKSARSRLAGVDITWYVTTEMNIEHIPLAIHSRPLVEKPARRTYAERRERGGVTPP